MENRHLPILHDNIALSVLPACRQAGVPRMSPIPWDEWVVKIVWNLLLLVINTNVAFDVGSQVAPIFLVNRLHLLKGRPYISISGIFDLAHLFLVDHRLAG